MFDLRFLVHHLKAKPQNIACTKIASKLLEPSRKSHSLKPLLKAHLGIEIDKTEQLSDWTKETLSSEQVAYATGDVSHLVALLEEMRDLLDVICMLDLYDDCLRHIPARVQLDLLKIADVYAY